MSLSFAISPAGEYQIIERIHSFFNTRTKVVVYSKDLSTKWVDSDPARPTTPACRAWFEKYHRKHFA
jgi:hypothetical protein